MLSLRHTTLILSLCAASFAVAADDVQPTKEGLEFFEKNVRPILSDRCYECHSANKNSSKGGLILDSHDGAYKGGDEGPAVVPGNLEKSLLIKAVRYTDPEFSMPPKKTGGKLPDDKIAILEEWVKMGAPMPVGGAVKLTGLTGKAREHWAFQPVTKPTVPEVKNRAWVKTPIDAFVLAKLEAKGLQPNPAASPESLLRRVSYDLIGLPPTSEQVDTFEKAVQAAQVADTMALRSGKPAVAVEAVYAKQVDSLLASPHYGERWARHWLDTARYSDTRGLQVDQGDSLFKDYRFAYAWTYRDYVINAMNEDKPYNNFIVEQLAADRIPGISPDDPRLAALGFLTVGKRFDDPNDIIDERIDTTTKAFLGLTVSCARCHDHKFDPIPIKDYYSLHGIFASTVEPLHHPTIAASSKTAAAARTDFTKRLGQLQDEQVAGFFRYMRETRARYDKEMAGRLMIASVRRGSSEAGEYSDRYKIDLTSDVDFAAMRIQKDSPITGPFYAVAQVPVVYFAERAPIAIKEALADTDHPVNPIIAAALRDLKPKTLHDVAAAYQKAYNENKAAILAHLAVLAKPGDGWKKTSPAIAEMTGYPWAIPSYDEVFDNEDMISLFSTRKFCADWQNRPIYGGIGNRAPVAYFRHTRINELRLSHPGAPGEAMVVQDSEAPKDSYVFKRGDKNNKGDIAPRQFLDILSKGERRPYVDGSGRYEFAQSIATKDNPMTARVAVNRTWMKHFIEGFVLTADDLGNMSEKPSHPELLDYLATDFMENGWTMKRLHRMIVMSNVYRLDSDPTANPLVVKKGPIDPLKVDAGNRLLWRGNLRRLDFESIRDSMILLTGKLNPTVGGQPANITDEPFSYRRSLYGYVDRSRLSDTLSQFDYGDPDQANSKRNSTIVPQQALYFMNNALSVEVARAVSARKDVVNAMSEDQRIVAMFRCMFQRRPSTSEIRVAQEFLAKAKMTVATANLRPSTKAAVAGTKPGAKAAAPVARTTAPAAKGMTVKAPDGEESMMTAVTGGGAESVMQNVGEAIARTPMTPTELLVQALLLSNEFVYVN
ncbi:MAG: PSD1 and planctomycete cytochrome C domain-containing protein [Verrucomicrobia bacterium]|nr:PSD1 and planctomycete cytochrome C domain-containing protein [Verrucomicrobiota bacterium]